MAAAPSVAAASAGPAGAASNFLVARLYRFLELLRAVRLRRDRRELGGPIFGERGVVLLQVFDQVQPGHPVVDVRAHRLTGADGLARVGEANADFVKVGKEGLIVLSRG